MVASAWSVNRSLPAMHCGSAMACTSTGQGRRSNIRTRPRADVRKPEFAAQEQSLKIRSHVFVRSRPASPKTPALAGCVGLSPESHPHGNTASCFHHPGPADTPLAAAGIRWQELSCPCDHRRFLDKALAWRSHRRLISRCLAVDPADRSYWRPNTRPVRLRSARRWAGAIVA